MARHYVIVVHGMGVQRESETAYEVIHRFAEVRKGLDPDSHITYRNLLPTSLSSQTVLAGKGHGWAEFRGIPVDPEEDTGPFDGLPATASSGRNFRFVDLRWSQILAEDEEDYACQLKLWTEALREKCKNVLPAPLQVKWADLLLEQIQDSALTIQAALTYYRPAWAKLIFEDILGDIHLYGDYARTRGKAVRHFHLVLDEIFVRDFLDWCRQEGTAPYQPPRFTILAHSLGTVMSFDALMYAFATAAIRDGTGLHPCPSLPFSGYTEKHEDEDEIWQRLASELESRKLQERLRQSTGTTVLPQAPNIPALFWRDCVTEFITLGSPIDKFHTLWYQNYLHMGFPNVPNIPTDWATGWIQDVRTRIAHVNLCDEQDPVGHHLDIAQATSNYSQVFATDIPVAYRDLTFRRYPIPGLAHIEYWRDHRLFRGIIWHVMKLPPAGEQSKSDYFVTDSFRELKGVYGKILVWAYFRISLIAAMTTGVLLIYGIGGLRYFGFSIGSVLAMVAACLLWLRPYSTEAYRAETNLQLTGDPTVKRVRLFVQRWRPRHGLFATLVAGAAEWRRILILQSQGEAYSLEDALKLNTRMAFKTQGGFWRNVWWRYALGLAWLLAAGSFLSFHPVGWNTSSEDSTGQLIALAVAILSLCYLGTMGFVTWAFIHAKQLKR
jgi:hypothetical protein